jgi:arylsulfatase A-like enzyme
VRRAPLLLALLAAGCGRPAPPVAVEPPPPPLRFRDANLVLVSFDALQAAHVGHLGYPRDVTPTIDAVAREGYTFTHAYSAASWTVPATMTWFTGVYPSEHRMVNKFARYSAREKTPANLRELAPSLTTLAEVLRAAGYATGGFTGNAGVSPGFGYEQGFDTYFAEPNRFGSFDRSVPKALEWLTANRDRKVFLFLHGYDAHGQCEPAGGLDYRYVEPGYDGRFAGSILEQEALREEGLASGRVTLRDADVRFWRAVYDEKIARADARFRQFLEAVRGLGLEGKTVFVLTSDHGTEVYEHRRFDHGFTLYDELLHVPLVVRAPGLEPRRVADRVGSIDLMPTLLDLLDVPVPPGVRGQLRGRSLVPALRGESVAHDTYAETDYREYTFKRSLLTADGWKLIATLESRTRELYHLPTDPGELKDLAAADPARADALQAQLFGHFRAIGHDPAARRWEVGLNPVYNSQAK